MHPIIIIGSGLAGYNLARELRKKNQSIPLTILTQDDGYYYSKPLLSTALTEGKTADKIPMIDAQSMSQQLHAEILTNVRVIKIKPKEQAVVLDNEQTLIYSKLVIAWGAEVIPHGIEEDGKTEILTVNNLADYRTFREALVRKSQITVVGAGLIGCEFTNDLINAGFKVSVVSLADAPLSALLPQSVAEALVHTFEQKGVVWHWNTKVQSMVKQNKRYELRLSNGSIIETDLVMCAIGLKPRTEMAKAAGLKVERGIQVNQYLETSEPHIYALGDCAEVCGMILQYTLPLTQCVKALAKTLNGHKTAVEYPAMPINIKTPICPIVVAPPPKSIEGHWQIQSAGQHIKAIFYDKMQQMRGFALTGDRVKEKLQLTTLLPPLLTRPVEGD